MWSKAPEDILASEQGQCLLAKVMEEYKSSREAGALDEKLRKMLRGRLQAVEGSVPSSTVVTQLIEDVFGHDSEPTLQSSEALLARLLDDQLKSSQPEEMARELKGRLYHTDAGNAPKEQNGYSTSSKHKRHGWPGGSLTDRGGGRPTTHPRAYQSQYSYTEESAPPRNSWSNGGDGYSHAGYKSNPRWRDSNS